MGNGCTTASTSDLKVRTLDTFPINFSQTTALLAAL